MLRLLSKGKYRDLVLGAALLAAGTALVLFPTQSMEAARQGLQLCANVIVPSLFPFFVLSAMVVELGMVEYLGRAVERLMWPLFRVSGAGASALVLGFVGGYPVGACTAIRLYEKGLVSRTQAQRLLAFCNNSGPAFILGVVGAGVFGDGKIGLMLYLTHVAASLCVGVLFRFYGRRGEVRRGEQHARVHVQTVRFSAAFTAAVKSSLSSVLNICAFVVFFTVVIRLLFLSGALEWVVWVLTQLLSPLGGEPEQVRGLITGLMEMSSGVASLTQTGQVPMAAFMLGWAGLCVHCQVLSFVGDSGLSSGTYFVGKALHGLLSALFMAGLSRVFALSQPVSGYLTQQVEGITQMEAGSALTVSTVAVWLLWLAFFGLTLYVVRRSKKRGGKMRRYAL